MTALDRITGGRIDRTRQFAAGIAICRHLRGKDELGHDELGPMWRVGSNTAPEFYQEFGDAIEPCPFCGAPGDDIRSFLGEEHCEAGLIHQPKDRALEVSV